MALTTGARLGPYEIVASLGAGGMARSTKTSASDVWIDSRQKLSRFSFGGSGASPVWSRDGRHLLFLTLKDRMGALIDRAIKTARKCRRWPRRDVLCPFR